MFQVNKLLFIYVYFYFFLQLIKHYEVRPDPSGKTVKPITRTLLVPATSMDLQFIDR